MKINEILDEIKTNNVMQLHMVHSSTQKPVIVTPSISNGIKKEISEIVKDQLKKCMDETQAEYNIIGCDDNVIETANYDDYRTNIDRILNEIATPTVKFKFKADKFDFFIYDFKDSNGDSIYFFRRTRKLHYLDKGFLGRLIEGTFQTLSDKNWLGVDGIVDFILYKDSILILQHISFERILKLRSEFAEQADKVLSNKTFDENIIGFEQFREDVKKNANYINRLAKLGSNNTATLFLQDLEATKNVFEKFNLGLNFDEAGNKIIYEDESQAGNIINLMQDAYYTTLIGKHLGVDGRR